MNSELKSKWLDALRGGEYKQGKDYLRGKEDTFCCLGVLCDVLGVGKWKKNVFVSNSGEEYISTLYPRDFGCELGISSLTQSKLIKMNDTGSSFTEIASYIEETL